MRLKIVCGQKPMLLIINSSTTGEEYQNHSFYNEYYKTRYQTDLSLPLPPILTNEFQYAKYLSKTDLKNIKHFLQEFTTQHLLPFMKKSTTQWNEQVVASRKGITSRLFNVGKKYFSASQKVLTPTTFDEMGALM